MDIRDAYFERFVELILGDSQVVLLTVDMGSAVVSKHAPKLGGRFINVGVAESNAVTMAAALSTKGFVPFVYGISAFLLNRARAQLRHDVSIGGRVIHLIGSGPGLTYAEDGPSHHALDDIGMMRGLPGFRTFSPWDGASAATAVDRARSSAVSTYVRLDKGFGLKGRRTFKELSNGLFISSVGSAELVVTTGTVLQQRNSQWESIQQDILVVYEINRDTAVELSAALGGYSSLTVVDESFNTAGLNSIVCEAVARHPAPIRVLDKSFQLAFVQEKFPRAELNAKYLSTP